MILKITAQVVGNIVIAKPIEVRKQSNIICLYHDIETNKFMISIRRQLKRPELSIPLCTIQENGIPKITFQQSEEENEMLRLIKHIESFGGFDKQINKILWEFSKYEWIEESGDTIISPIPTIQINRSNHSPRANLITNEWLQDIVMFSDMMKDLYIPFSFFREGGNYFNEEKYLMAFASYYWMLEYFFVSERGYGINNNAYKENICLKTCLQATLCFIKNLNDVNYIWLMADLKRLNKKYDEEGLLYIINKNRDELLHASPKNVDKRAFNEYKYKELAFISMNLCMNVQKKMRLLPFVKKSDVNKFFSDTYNK